MTAVVCYTPHWLAYQPLDMVPSLTFKPEYIGVFLRLERACIVCYMNLTYLVVFLILRNVNLLYINGAILVM